MSLSDIYNLGIGLIVVLFIIGLIPAFIAYSRNHAYRHIILVLCLFGSWTGILWIIAFIWSVWPSDKSIIDPVVNNVTGTGQRSTGHSIGEVQRDFETTVNKVPTNSIASNTQSDTRECPFCAETIKAAAKMCRFCKSPLNPTEILQNEQDDLQNFSRSNFSDEDYLQNNIYRKINHQSLIYYKLPNNNYVVYFEAKYYIFDDKDKFDRALKQYESTSFLSEEYCLRVIDEQQTSILKKIASNLEIEQAKNRWK